MRPQIIIYDHYEYTTLSGKPYMQVTDKGGIKYNIAEKRNAIWPIFKDAPAGEPIMILWDTYNKVEYIADARSIKDDLLKLAIKGLGDKVNDALADERNRSTALSYSKDMVCAKIIDLDKLIEQSQINYEFIKGGR